MSPRDQAKETARRRAEARSRLPAAEHPKVSDDAVGRELLRERKELRALVEGLEPKAGEQGGARRTKNEWSRTFLRERLRRIIGKIGITRSADLPEVSKLIERIEAQIQGLNVTEYRLVRLEDRIVLWAPMYRGGNPEDEPDEGMRLWYRALLAYQPRNGRPRNDDRRPTRDEALFNLAKYEGILDGHSLTDPQSVRSTVRSARRKLRQKLL